MKIIKLCILCLFFSLTGAARKWSPENYPNPIEDVTSCGRKGVSSWICDPDGIVSYESANVAEGIIKKIFAGQPPYTLGPCGSLGLKGYQVAVALMRRMQYTGDAGVAAGQFARSLHDHWGVGDPSCNNGVVLFVSIEDRQIFISAGSGTTHLLTHDVLGDIISDVRPALKDQRYDEAVERAVVDIGLALAGRSVQPEGGQGRWWEELLGLGIFGSVVCGFIFFAARSESRKRKRYHDCESKLEKLKRDQAAVRSSTYNPTSCPVCLEDFTEVNGVSSPRAGSGALDEADAGGGAAAAGDVQMGAKLSEKEEEEQLRKPLLSSGVAASTSATGAAVYPGGEAPSAPSLPAQAGGGPPLSAAQQAPQQRRPLVLPCGHAFCESCITQWLEQKKVTCPICRKPFDEDDSPQAGDPRDTNVPRPPRPDTNRSNPADQGSSGGPGPSASSGPRPPCTVDEDEGYSSRSYGSTMYGSCAVPRLRLRWGSRRRPMRLQEDMLMAEMLFRLRQLQRQHPDYISNSMLSSWEQDVQNGREFSAQQLRQFQLNDPAVRRELAHSGSSGTGVRFGGGSSRGGGGRGGSW